MKRRYMDYCIIGILKEYAAGRTTEELCRKHAMTDAHSSNNRRQQVSHVAGRNQFRFVIHALVISLDKEAQCGQVKMLAMMSFPPLSWQNFAVVNPGTFIDVINLIRGGNFII
ncbi:MAG: hypothetical protein QGG19_16050 [Alphaproteobacteria bacterium]|nr:hypothetical protein [Alphaproteobacteria bacterium]MDP6253888.1 hypothetical protein [Alphaproteobacteria bacterium]MDP7056473.1 hypothetical protein [Alphaproteobacteria bacterium]MDP7230420.1 hypothetical protein [Alphaproteobacteria bacterium]MDP7458998.1 hypothetical protein [Alphaproteobacteria bacterium]